MSYSKKDLKKLNKKQLEELCYKKGFTTNLTRCKKIFYENSLLKNENLLPQEQIISNKKFDVDTKYIKNIKIDKLLSINNYENKDFFEKYADVVLDYSSRKTLIKLKNLKNPNDKYELIYIFLIDGKIVKFGGSINGLKERFNSYLCGHHTIFRGKSGKMSVTNAYIYNTFLYYLKLNKKIEIYIYRMEDVIIQKDYFNSKYKLKVRVQTYNTLEDKLIKSFISKYNYKPPLNNNSNSRN